MLDLKDPRKLLHLLFNESAAGVQISSDLGGGKSNTLELLLRYLIHQGMPIFVLDPHGSLVRRLRNYMLDAPPRIRNRLVWIEPGNTQRVTAMNPLAVPTVGLDEHAWKSKVTVKCAHTAKILLTIWEQDTFASTPRLAKWVSRLLRTLAMAGLSLADVRHFLDVGSPVYRSLVRAVPDLLARQEFVELSDMRPTDRENLIESTKNRFLGLLENPIVETTFGLVDGAIDVTGLYQEGRVVLIDLSPQGALRDEDQMIFANLWLSEILHVVFNLPENQRRPAFVGIDELPVFSACSSLLGGPQGALTQVRKFLLRFLCCHQGVVNFPKGKDDRLLNNLIGQCGVHIYLRHANPLDAKFFGEVVALPGYDPHLEKHRLVQQQQYQAGNQIVTLQDESFGSSEADAVGGGDSSSDTQTDSWGHDDATSATDTRTETRDARDLRQAVATARAAAQTHRSSHGGSSAHQHSTNSSWRRTTSTSESRTYKQTIVPILKWRDVVTSVTFYTPEEQFLTAASRFAELPTGTAIVHVSGKGVAEVTFPLVTDPFRRTPRFLQRKLAEFERILSRDPDHSTPRQIEQARRMILEQLLISLNSLAYGEQAELRQPGLVPRLSLRDREDMTLPNDPPPPSAPGEESTLGI